VREKKIRFWGHNAGFLGPLTRRGLSDTGYGNGGVGSWGQRTVRSGRGDPESGWYGIVRVGG